MTSLSNSLERLVWYLSSWFYLVTAYGVSLCFLAESKGLSCWQLLTRYILRYFSCRFAKITLDSEAYFVSWTSTLASSLLPLYSSKLANMATNVSTENRQQVELTLDVS